MIRVDKTAVSDWIDYEIDRLERLLSDLKRIRSRAGPTAEDLDDAPRLDHYQLSRRDVICLVGQATGHPRLGDRQTITTELMVYAPTLGWARTLSRFYRLGTSIDDNHDAPEKRIGLG